MWGPGRGIRCVGVLVRAYLVMGHTLCGGPGRGISYVGALVGAYFVWGPLTRGVCCVGPW